MVFAHMLVAGPVEAVVTGGVVVYLQRTHSSLIKADAPKKKEGKTLAGLGCAGLGCFGHTIGLLASGTAWGEWGVDELKTMGLGSIPQGLQKLAGWWPAPMPDYGFAAHGGSNRLYSFCICRDYFNWNSNMVARTLAQSKK